MWWPLGVLVLLQGLVFRQLRVQISRIVSGKDPQAAADFVADTLLHGTLDLDVLTGLLTTLERQQFAGDRLQHLQARLNADGNRRRASSGASIATPKSTAATGTPQSSR